MDPLRYYTTTGTVNERALLSSEQQPAGRQTHAPFSLAEREQNARREMNFLSTTQTDLHRWNFLFFGIKKNSRSFNQVKNMGHFFSISHIPPLGPGLVPACVPPPAQQPHAQKTRTNNDVTGTGVKAKGTYADTNREHEKTTAHAHTGSQAHFPRHEAERSLSCSMRKKGK